jgi:hypothetical protein
MAVVVGALVAGAIAGFVVAPQLLGNGVTVTSASTPGSPTTRVSPATADPAGTPPEPFGTGMLLQTDDFYQLGLDFDGADQRSDGRQRLSGCTGARTMQDLSAAGAGYASAVWRSEESAVGGRTTLRESVSRGDTARSVHRLVSALTGDLSGCRYRQHGDDRRLGSPVAVHAGSGNAVRFVAFNADGAAIGGVGVFHNGRSFGIFELVGSGSDEPGDMLDSLSAAAVKRIS